MQVIAWRTVSEMTYNVSSGTFNLTHSLTHCRAVCLTERRFVEITTVFQGLHGLSRAKTKYEHQYLHHLNREATYVCNYRSVHCLLHCAPVHVISSFLLECVEISRNNWN